MYRKAGRPRLNALLREVMAYPKNASECSENDSNRLPPEVQAQDSWDFDGAAILATNAAGGSHGVVKAVVFPHTDAKSLKDIESLSRVTLIISVS